MATTYTADFDYILHTSARVTHKLVVVEEQYDIYNRTASLSIFIERQNSGREHDADGQYIELKINGETVAFINNSGTPILGENSSDTIELKPDRYNDYFKVNYDSNGTKNVKIELTYKSERLGLILATAWGTIATSEVSFDLPAIDMSLPTISNISVKADRYGLNAMASFSASHAVYNLYEIRFKLSGLTSNQAHHRRNTDRIEYGNSDFDGAGYRQDYGSNGDGTYWFEVILVYPIKQSTSVYLDLDDRPCDPPYALDSGGSYPWELKVTAFNNVSATRKGTLKVPQKVTGLTCEERIDMMPGDSLTLGYQVTPDNAEDPSVVFESTNTSVAMVNTQGVVTAVGEGVCQIIVTTADGGAPDAPGFTQRCSVSVLNTKAFPELNEIRYLTDREIVKISAACQFLYEKLIEKNIYVPELLLVECEGKRHPVKGILTVLETINSNCIILKNASDSAYHVDYLSNEKHFLKQNEGLIWYILVNEWISFLIALNQKITEA